MPVCKVTGKQFSITDDDRAFYEKISVPEPTLCPSERLRRRMAYRNDMTLYRSKCAKTGKPIISQFAPDSGMTVYNRELWWSDEWDPMEFGRDYDFGKSFFEQFHELQKTAPHPNLITINAENSDYTNYNFANRNCYMCFTGNHLEDSYYCYNADNCKDCCDCLFVWECENCYQCTNCTNCYSLQFGLHSTNCSNSYFIEDCRNCKNCLLCYGLDFKEFCILNQQYTKEEYEQKLALMNLQTSDGQEKALKIWRQESGKYPKRENQNYQCEECTGEYMHQCKNCHECYIMSKGCEDCKYIFNGFPAFKDGMDCLFCGANAEIIYESVATGERGGKLLFCNICVNGCYDLSYCDFLVNCKDCFGCSSLRNKQYCILNKQYSKVEYETLKIKIIEHMKSTGEYGEFFDAKYSPFGYNETFANVWMPLTKEEAMQRGHKWREEEDIATQEARAVPENTILCKVSGKPFKIIEQEKRFYKRNNIPEPTKCFDIRHKERLSLRVPMKVWY